MKQVGDLGFAERRDAALEAKKRLLLKFKAAPKPDDPEVQARLAERQALAEARDARKAERAETKRLEAERERAEAEAAAIAKALETEAAEAASAEESAARELADKAERDRRYAARKARKR